MKRMKICERKDQVKKEKKTNPEIDGNFKKITVINPETKFELSFLVPKRYSNLKFLNSGAQGTVVSADDSVTGRKVAIKKMRVQAENARHAYREFMLMTTIQHPTIILFLNAFTPNPSLSDFEDIYLVMELMPYSLSDIIYGKGDERPRVYDHLRLSFAIYQMLCAIKHLHDSGVTHRDLKPQNIVVNLNGDLKIVDFGLARKMSSTQMTHYVATRSYRAPEIIFEEKYTGKVDIWSIGCIIAEMINHRPLFYVSSSQAVPKNEKPTDHKILPVDLLKKIFETLGTPDLDLLRKWSPGTAVYFENPERKEPKKMEEIIDDVEEEKKGVGWTNEKLRDLLGKMLKIDPNERISAVEALDHEYLGNWKRTKNPQVLAMAQNSHPEGTHSRYNPDIEKEEKSLEEWKELIFEEVQRFQREHDVFKD